VVSTIDRAQLQVKVEDAIETVLRDRWKEFARPDQPEVDWAGLQVQLEREIHRLLRRELQSSPLLVFLMQNPEPATTTVKTTPGRQRSAARVAS
jgi:ribonuclease J